MDSYLKQLSKPRFSKSLRKINKTKCCGWFYPSPPLFFLHRSELGFKLLNSGRKQNRIIKALLPTVSFSYVMYYPQGKLDFSLKWRSSLVRLF